MGFFHHTQAAAAALIVIRLGVDSSTVNYDPYKGKTICSALARMSIPSWAGWVAFEDKLECAGSALE